MNYMNRLVAHKGKGPFGEPLIIGLTGENIKIK
jgi:hypothetical protein